MLRFAHPFLGLKLDYDLWKKEKGEPCGHGHLSDASGSVLQLFRIVAPISKVLSK